MRVSSCFRSVLTCSLLLAAMSPLVRGQVSTETPGWFAFTMSPTDNAVDSPMDMSFLNAGGAGSRIALKNGQFVKENGERVRFLATNVTFSSCFPDKEDTPAIAKRLAQLGFNLVRFHHMDARDIWLPKQAGLDPEKLDRLDWFIYQLKENGIYTNINLHVSRTYPGMKAMDLPRTYRYGKVLDKLYDSYIDLQEGYAKDLLDRKNQYTGLRLTEDPAVAFVEINNENTLLSLPLGQLDALPDPFRTELEAKWRTWLGTHYSTLERLKGAWNAGVQPLGAAEILRNPQFAPTLEGWELEGEKPGVCSAAPGAVDGASGAVEITMTQPGEVAWAYQLHQVGVPAVNGQCYTLRFRGRAEPARSVSVGLRFAQKPWSFVSQRQSFELTPEWQEFTLAVDVDGVAEGVPVRLSFNMGDAVGKVGIATPSLRTGRELFEADGVKEVSGVGIPAPNWPPNAWGDFRLFLIDTERDYVKRMRRCLKDQLRVKSLVIDTQASYGGYWGTYREASLSDYIDMHAYWQHPRFPHKPWDRNDWLIKNISMVADEAGGTLAKLAHRRVLGMPFSVSEYNHPTPNDHAAELFPMLSTFAAHQDWDAIYQFCYGNSTLHMKSEKLSGYFGLSRQAAQLVFAPMAAIAFRTGAVAPAAGGVTVALPLEALRAKLPQRWPDYRELLPAETVPVTAVLGGRYQVTFVEEGAAPILPSLPAPPADGSLIKTDQITWQANGETSSYTVQTPSLRAAAGFVGGRTLALADSTITVKLEDGTWACCALAALDGKPIAESARMLLSIATRIENTGMGWREDRRTIGNKWGRPPIVAQGVPAEIVLPGTAKPRVCALTPAGSRAGDVAVSGTAGEWRVCVGPEYKTLWYAIER